MLKVLQKNKNAKWYETINEMYFSSVGNDAVRSDFADKLKLYRFFNNDLQDYNDLLNKMCNDALSQSSAEELLLSYNKIRNKYDVLHGELLRRGNNHKIILLTAKAIKSKNDKFVAAIQESVEKDLQLVMGKAIETLQSMPQQDLEKFIEQERQLLTPRDIKYKNFLSDVEIYKSKMLKHINLTDDILKKKVDSFQHQFISSEFYLKNSWKHGRPTIQLLNPLYCKYHKSGNEFDVAKSDWFMYSDEITVGAALDEYANTLGTKELEDLLESGTGSSIPDKSHLTDLLHDYSQFNLARSLREDSSMWGLSETESSNSWLNNSISRSHIEFKAWDELLFYTHKDEYNDEITLVLEADTNIIPENASKIEYKNEYFEKDFKYVWADDFGSHEVIIKWVPQRYEMTRLGNGTLVETRKVPFQPQYSENPISSFRLSYKGGVFNNINSKACSRMESAIPSQLQILVLKQLQNKEMSKYRGFTLGRDIAQIPMDLASKLEKPEDILTAIDVIGKKTGTEFFDSEASRNGVPNPQRSSPLIPMQLGSAESFILLQNAIQALDIEVGLACGVSPSREGQVLQGTNVTDNQQALVQTSLATERDYYEHGRVWTEALDESLGAWDIYFQHFFENNPDAKETFLEHAMPDGTRELIKILPEYVHANGLGVYLQDTYSDKEYKEMMKMQINQNTQELDIETRSAINKSISSGASTEEIHREIQMMMEGIRRRQQEQQEAEANFLKQKEEADRNLLKYQSELRTGEAIAITDSQTALKIRLAELDAEKWRMQNDVNKDNVDDKLMQIDKEYKHKKELQEAEDKTKIEVAKINAKSKVGT